MATSLAQVNTDQPDAHEFQPLLDRARQGDLQALGQLLQWYANYLTILATSQLDRRIRRRVSPSDVVQEVLLAAHRDFGDFRGNSQPELLMWIRRILINTLHRSFETHVKAGKRDIRREVSIDAITQSVDHSAGQLLTLIQDRVAPPSARMSAEEDALVLANQLGRLRPAYRDVIVYRVVQGLSFDEIGEAMGKSTTAVRMLWLRALDAFKVQGSVPNVD
jgi:RNA polymerase sigma-70 factor, ECF subfamily